jgi:hypothetical protein
MITVKKINDTSFEVSVNVGTTTKHKVTLSEAYYRKLTDGIASPELLIQKSFEFLLEREPNTSILSTFELQVISRYFSEYESAIGKMLGNT